MAPTGLVENRWNKAAGHRWNVCIVRSRHPEDEGEVLAGRPLDGGEDAGPVAPTADPFCPTRASSSNQSSVRLPA
jgi:hypothetical protein